ncbi:UNVERIFIED_CONTAM: Sugar transport protein 8 [Sesamum latifolium]|uniref:Sugar transport protein 8 n=1 Tax=Sesamum latifolium TaxID=2727402 RepID=A0AAW2XT50_9LAMI
MSTADKSQYNSRVTPYVFSCWILAAFGGLMFGYDIGISGGVTGMDEFLMKFFPKVHERKLHAHENNYCKYDDEMLQLFTSSLYIAALVASFFASKACSLLGRRPTILMASLFFIAGSIFCGAANAKWMLIFGRVLFGIGVGFGNEAVPLFLSEIAPIHHRGAVNILFQLLVTVGILVANLINYGTAMMKHGWRVSLGLAAVPGLILFIGSLIVTGCEQAKQVKRPFKKLFKKSGFPALFISTIIQVFQQFTGINAIMFYAPVLFQTLGFKSDASLLSAVITGLVNVGATFVSIYAVDKVGRRKLLLQASVQMFISQVAIGAILVTHLKATGTLDKVLAAVVVVLVCTFVMSFAWSWGPMGWLIPSEIFPIETRTAGFPLDVVPYEGLHFLLLLCLDSGNGTLCGVPLPETKGVPIELVEERVWKQHPVWKKFFKDEGKETTD